MTLISTGSTLTPSFSSHLIAALMSWRLPSSSRLTMPISSVTLAWRIFVTTGNFWLSFQIKGSLINRGGYISHSRVCSGEVSLVSMIDFFFGMSEQVDILDHELEICSAGLG